MNPLFVGRKVRPTQRHLPAMWECMLGTVYARSAAGVTRYFDYDYEGAALFAGVDAPGTDPRTARAPRSYPDGPRRGQFVLFLNRSN